MKRREFTLGAALVAVPGLLALPAHAQSGPGYVTLKERAPVDAPAGQVEVVEFFSYGCAHCKNCEPTFQAWKKAAPKDVAVHMVHVGFQSSFEPLQRIYYTLETMGPAALDKVHAKVFEALQTERKRLDKPEVLFPWIAEQGIDRAMALDQAELDLDDLKWVVLMVLFNQPGSEAAYAWMETQMFLDEPEPVH